MTLLFPRADGMETDKTALGETTNEDFTNNDYTVKLREKKKKKKKKKKKGFPLASLSVTISSCHEK